MSVKRNHDLAAFVLPYVIRAFALTFAAFFVVAAVYLFVPFGAGALKVITAVISVIVILTVSYSASKASESVLAGGITALIYSVIHSLAAVIFGIIPFLSVRTPFIIVTGFLSGLIGGVFGGGGRMKRR